MSVQNCFGAFSQLLDFGERSDGFFTVFARKYRDMSVTAAIHQLAERPDASCRLQQLLACVEKHPQHNSWSLREGAHKITAALQHLPTSQATAVAQVATTQLISSETSKTEGKIALLCQLPQEILQAILEYLDLNALRNLAGVNRWMHENALITSYGQIVANEHFSACILDDPTLIEVQRRSQFPDQLIDAYTSQVRSLNIAGCDNITDSTLQAVAQLFPNLQSLNLSQCSFITGIGVSHICKLPQLQSINLDDCELITDAALCHLADAHQLDTLDLSECPITDTGMQYLKNLSRLRCLFLTGCTSVTDAGVEHLTSLRQLQELDLSTCPITDESIQTFESLSQLQRLFVNGCTSITAAGEARLDGLSQLQCLGCWI